MLFRSSTEWASNNTGNVDVIFAMDANALDTLAAGFKGRSFEIQSGTINAINNPLFLSGNFIVRGGAKFISSRTGSAAIAATSTTPCPSINLDLGSFVEMSGTDPRIDCVTFTNNGTVIYTNTAAGNTLQPTASGATNGATSITSYKNIFLSGSAAKSIPVGQTITVSDTIKIGRAHV